MIKLTPLEQLQLLTGESDEELLLLFLELSKQKILNYTNREVMLDSFNNVLVNIALILYNRRGLEGESSHSEGGISQSFYSIDEVLSEIKDKRLMKIAVKKNE